MSGVRATGRNISTGRLGEKLAREYLTRSGYNVIRQNERTPYGEIDLIACQENTWVFVEVKTRRTRSLGPPEVSVDARKQEHLLNAVAFYCQNYLTENEPWRIDVIAIQIDHHDEPEIHHFENALAG